MYKEYCKDKYSRKERRESPRISVKIWAKEMGLRESSLNNLIHGDAQFGCLTEIVSSGFTAKDFGWEHSMSVNFVVDEKLGE